MSNNTVTTLVSALQLDIAPLVNQFMFIEELNNADGSFIISAVMKEQMLKEQVIILILCHNSVGHFHSIGLKLNYNVSSLIEEKKIYVINILDKIVKDNFLSSKEPIKNLYLEIKKLMTGWDRSKGVCIVLENIGNFSLINIDDIYSLIGYFRSIAYSNPNSSFICSFHNFTDCADSCKFSRKVKRTANITLELNDLETGKADDVSGHLTIVTRSDKHTKHKTEYHYRIVDKDMLVFSPGYGKLPLK